MDGEQSPTHHFVKNKLKSLTLSLRYTLSLSLNNFRAKIWEEGFKKGKFGEEHGVTPEIIAWLDKAMDVYWQQQFSALLVLIETMNEQEFLEKWQIILEEMCADN